MKTRHSIKSLIMISALALSLGAKARADDMMPASKAAPAAGNLGLLGQVYGTLTYGYIDLDSSSIHGDNYSLSLNQPLAFGLDGILSYEFSETGDIAGARGKRHTLAAALRAFSSSYNWGKPYLEAGGGYARVSTGGIDDNSLVWEVAGGIEFQVAPATTVTPYVQYMDAPELTGDGAWNFGVKASHWVNSQWAVTAGLATDNNQNTTFTVGTNFRF